MISVSSPKIEGLYQASKWLSFQLLIDDKEMEELLQFLGDFQICLTGQILKSNEEFVSKEAFLSTYKNYLRGIKRGKLIDESFYRPLFSSIFTKTEEALYRVNVIEEQFLIRVKKPVLQLQVHRMHYSKHDGTFRPMIFGEGSIYWGIQFSYPQLFQDNQTKEILNVLKSPQFPNNKLLKLLQKWIRQHTIPTPFKDLDKIDSKEMKTPIRIGKNCLSWINCHPQLIEKDLRVVS